MNDELLNMLELELARRNRGAEATRSLEAGDVCAWDALDILPAAAQLPEALPCNAGNCCCSDQVAGVICEGGRCHMKEGRWSWECPGRAA